MPSVYIQTKNSPVFPKSLYIASVVFQKSYFFCINVHPILDHLDWLISWWVTKI